MKVTHCRLCNGKLSEPKINLGSTPLANEFLPNKINQDLFPLEVCVCELCQHYQLNESVDPERLFRHYVYVAGTSNVNVKHFRDYAEHMIDKFKYELGSKVLDIASNDGTLLKHFKELGMQVLGIDPAINLAEDANKNGIETIPEFFTNSYADTILEKYGKFDLITANNVFAHVPDLIGFTLGVRKLLNEQGIFSFEVSYFLDVCNKTLFDTIYHEHTSYHTITPLIKFFKSHQMKICEVEYIPNHGGSIRIFVCHEAAKYPEIVDISKENNLEEKVIKLQQDILTLSATLNNSLKELHSFGKKIVIYGVPAKATTLIYGLKIDPKLIEFAVDDNQLKQNTFTPGTHIPVFNSSVLYEMINDIDCLLILAWNFAESIITKCKEHGFNGTFIVPLPEYIKL